MSLKNLSNAGDMAARLVQAATNFNTFTNRFWPEYTGLLEGVRTALENPDITLSGLTTDFINLIFFDGRGAADELEEARVILSNWETVILALKAASDACPVNDA